MISSTASVGCSCTHLTEFAGIIIPTSADELLAEITSIKFNTFTLDEAAAVLGNFDLDGNPDVYIAVFTLASANFVTLVWASWRGVQFLESHEC